jgi:hydrogenase 3 maturation protease
MNSEEFHRTLKPYPASRLVFMGIGNPIRGDDGAGLLFLDKLIESGWYSTSHFISAGVNPENYLQKILEIKPRAVVFIDAAHFHAVPGTIAWLDQTQLDQIRIITHAFSMVLVEAYLQSHQWMDFHYLAVEPESTELGEGLTRTVRESIEQFFERN